MSYNDEDKLSKSMAKNEELFIEYTRELVEVLVNFCVLALVNFKNAAGHPLNSLDISKIIRREIQNVVNTVLEEDYMELIEERSRHLFSELS